MTPHADLADKLRRAARNGTRLHLDAVNVRVLMSPTLYGALSILEAEELNALCQQDNQPVDQSDPPASSVINSARSGCGIALIATTGRSVGSMAEQRAAEALVSQAALQISRQKKHSRH